MAASIEDQIRNFKCEDFTSMDKESVMGRFSIRKIDDFEKRAPSHDWKEIKAVDVSQIEQF